MADLKGVFSRLSDNWATPKALLAALDAEFGFDDDPCPLRDTLGLLRPWGRRVFVNPPYSDIARFFLKARGEMIAGRTDLAVFLIPSRTDTRYWHTYVWDEHTHTEGRRELALLEGTPALQ